MTYNGIVHKQVQKMPGHARRRLTGVENLRPSVAEEAMLVEMAKSYTTGEIVRDIIENPSDMPIFKRIRKAYYAPETGPGTKVRVTRSANRAFGEGKFPQKLRFARPKD